MNNSLPELVQKNIAGFLQPINRNCTIRIQQNAGCMKGDMKVLTIIVFIVVKDILQVKFFFI